MLPPIDREWAQNSDTHLSTVDRTARRVKARTRYLADTCAEQTRDAEGEGTTMSARAGRTPARSKRSITSWLERSAAVAVCSVSLITAVPAMAQNYPRPEGASASVSTNALDGAGGLDATSIAIGDSAISFFPAALRRAFSSISAMAKNGRRA